MNLLLSLLPRLTQLSFLVPAVINLYSQIKQLGITDVKALKAIVDFARSKNVTLEKYITSDEVLMLVCAIIGLLHEGDSSDLYNKLKEAE